ncbi:MAG: cytochrome c, partial [Pseudomonadota bacterium]
MRRTALFCLVLLAPASTTIAALLPGDAASGKPLHDGRCLGCHDSRVYTRPDRKLKTVEGLMGQVRMCNQQLNTNLSREQLNDIVRYLNETFYKFP